MSMTNRRDVVAGLSAFSIGLGLGSNHAHTQPSTTFPDLILFNGRITTLNRQRPEVSAIAVKDGRFLAVGDEREIMALAGDHTARIDLKGRRAVPGLIDSHTHLIRGGLNYNMELR